MKLKLHTNPFLHNNNKWKIQYPCTSLLELQGYHQQDLFFFICVTCYNLLKYPALEVVLGEAKKEEEVFHLLS